jgi:hypothetical protein
MFAEVVISTFLSRVNKVLYVAVKIRISRLYTKWEVMTMQ